MSKIVDYTQDKINENIGSIIEAFVKVYGEDKRSFIEEKFSNMKVVAYAKPDDLNTYYLEHTNEKKKELFEKLSKEVPVKPEWFCSQFSPEIDNKYNSINSYINLQSMDKNSREYELNLKGSMEFLKSFIPDITVDNYEEKIKNSDLTEMNKVLDAYKKVLDEYGVFLKDYESEKQEIDEFNEKEKKINNKWYEAYLEEFKEYIPKEEYDNYKNGVFYDNKFINNYLGSSITYGGPILAFTTESEEALKNDSGWKKESVISDRIRFFKSFGIDHGDDYEAYLKDEACLKIIPPKEFADKLIKSKNEYHEKAKLEVYESLSSYQKIKGDIKNSGIVTETIDPSLYEYGTTCVTIGFKKENDKLVLYPVVFINALSDKSHFNTRLIHELNHVYETELIDLDEKTGDFSIISGWDYIKDNAMGENSFEHSKNRTYEVISEITNELIAQRLTNEYHEMGKSAFEGEGKQLGGTGYQKNAVMLYPLFNEYFNDIINSRSGNNIEVIYDRFGKENFEEFSQLLNEYNDAFSGFNYYNLVYSLNNNIVDENTKKYDEFIKRRDELVEKMKTYSNSNKKR